MTIAIGPREVTVADARGRFGVTTTTAFRAALLLAVALSAVPAPCQAEESSLSGRFREVAAAWGVDFRHHHGGSGHRYMIETMVGGVVIFDFDGDGDDDIFFVDGGVLPGYEGETPRSRLFRNDGGRFVDYTDRSGIDFDGYGSGAVSGDYDDDGDIDLYITAVRANSLWENNGDGTFVEVTAEAGVADELWSVGACFSDVDRDGDLDLYVANYVDWSVENDKFCGDRERGIRTYCDPGKYNGLPDTFYHNRGDGTFEERTREAGLSGPAKAGLGVVAADLDNDGWPDLYVANDADSNFLFHNRGDGTFEDLSLLSGTAYGDEGRAEAGMGVDLGDVDGDGWLDIVVTNFEHETNALYKNLGDVLFVDARFLSNFAEGSLLKLAFGIDLADLDNDGDLDAIIANGHIHDNTELFDPTSRYAQENQILENVGGGRFRLVQDPGFDDVGPSRGLATGDLDRDGDLDVVVVNTNAPAVVYENRGAPLGDWLQLDLVARASNSFGIGARVEVSHGERRQVDEVRAGSSYLSQNALTLHFGVGRGGESGATVRVLWPSGVRQQLSVPLGNRLRLYEPDR